MKGFRSFFDDKKLGIADYFLGGLFFLFCYFSFFHGDIWDTGWNSLNYLFGNPHDFYENCTKIHKFSPSYPPSIFIIFAIWLYPLKFFGFISSPEHFPLYLLTYWLKFLTSIMYVSSGFVFYKITQIYRQDKEWGKYAFWIWLTSPLAFFSQFIFSQYDIFYVFLTLLGFFFFLRGKIFSASVIFGFAVTFKYFPFFVFIPLLVFFEKKTLNILVSVILFAIPTSIVYLFYGDSPSFIEGVRNFSPLARVFSASLDIGGPKIFYLFAVFSILTGVCYTINSDKKNANITAAYIFLISTIFPFLFILWHPQWMLFVTPAIALTTMLDRRMERFFLIDLAGMFFFVAYCALAFENNVDTGLFRSELFHIPFSSYKMSHFFNFFGEYSRDVFLSLFWSYLLFQIIVKYNLVKDDFNVLKGYFISYDKVRFRYYAGILIFIIPVLLVLYKNYLDSKKYSYIIHDSTQKIQFGELIKGRVFEQSFIAKTSHLDQIELMLATFNRVNHGTFNIELINEKNEILLKEIEQMDGVRDNQWQSFNFIKKIHFEEGHVYKLRLFSDNSSVGNAITWWAVPKSTIGDDKSLKENTARVDGSVRASDFTIILKFRK